MRVVVTGADGRLGSALCEALPRAGIRDVWPWGRREFDLDRPEDLGDRLGPLAADVVIHAAAWTDVDGCAREPEAAMRRNGEATGLLAAACAAAGGSLLYISTNEVFDGLRTDGQGYLPTDVVAPANAYGRSKLAGESGAQAVFDGAGRHEGVLGIVRTAWLFGEGKPDFPARIAAAARQASVEGHSLKVVGDEIGTPTAVSDVAWAVALAVASGPGGLVGTHHVVNAGIASRAEWARDVVTRLGIDIDIEEIRLEEYVRPSRPPRWGVLEATPLPGSHHLRPWRLAMAERAGQLLEVAAL